MTSCALLLSTYLAACGSASDSLALSARPAAHAMMVSNDVATPAEAAVRAFATLNGSGFAWPVATSGAGSCALSVSPGRRQAMVRVTTTLSSPSEVHLHVAGSERHVDLSPQPDTAGAPPRGARWSSTFLIDDAMFAALLRGELYCDVHSAAYPEGELRGTLSATP